MGCSWRRRHSLGWSCHRQVTPARVVKREVQRKYVTPLGYIRMYIILHQTCQHLQAHIILTNMQAYCAYMYTRHAPMYVHIAAPTDTHYLQQKEIIPPAPGWILVLRAEVQRIHLIGRYLVISLFGIHLCQRHTNSKGDYCNDKRVLDDTSNDVLYVGV